MATLLTLPGVDLWLGSRKGQAMLVHTLLTRKWIHPSCISQTRANVRMDLSYLQFVQWPAMVVTLLAAWLMTFRNARRRLWAFRLFVLSNVLWIVWGLASDAYSLVLLQVGLFLINFKGVEELEISRS